MEVNSPIAEKWLKFSANNLRQKFWSKQWKEYYEKKLSEYSGQMKELIKQDVKRSCFELNDYPRLQNKLRQKLTNVLHAYCSYDPEIGYTQGMNYIVERLLAHLTDYQAYIVWLGIIKTDDFRNFYCESFGDKLLESFQETIEDLRVKFPNLSSHLGKVTQGKPIFGFTENNPLYLFYGLFTKIAMTLGCCLPINNKIKDKIITMFLQDRNKTYTTNTILFGVIRIIESELYKQTQVDELYQLLCSEKLEKYLKGENVLESGEIVRNTFPIDIPLDSENFWYLL
jgi:hypothetical protein